MHDNKDMVAQYLLLLRGFSNHSVEETGGDGGVVRRMSTDTAYLGEGKRSGCCSEDKKIATFGGGGGYRRNHNDKHNDDDGDKHNDDDAAGQRRGRGGSFPISVDEEKKASCGNDDDENDDEGKNDGSGKRSDSDYGLAGVPAEETGVHTAAPAELSTPPSPMPLSDSSDGPTCPLGEEAPGAEYTVSHLNEAREIPVATRVIEVDDEDEERSSTPIDVQSDRRVIGADVVVADPELGEYEGSFPLAANAAVGDKHGDEEMRQREWGRRRRRRRTYAVAALLAVTFSVGVGLGVALSDEKPGKESNDVTADEEGGPAFGDDDDIVAPLPAVPAPTPSPSPSTSPPSSTSPTSFRYQSLVEHLRPLLLTTNDADDLNGYSPQSLALEWLNATTSDPRGSFYLPLNNDVEDANGNVNGIVTGDGTMGSSFPPPAPLSPETQERLFQRYALAVFYYSAGGPKWNNALSDEFLSTFTHECDWKIDVVGGASHYTAAATSVPVSSSSIDGNAFSVINPETSPERGVTGCDDLLRVTRLDFQSYALTGSVPEEIRGLPRLQTINLSNNELAGIIPSSIASLTNLEFISFDKNRFGGPIPENLGDLTKLRGFYAASNILSGTLPPSFGDLVLLEDLHLEDNGLSGSIPDEVSNMVSLRNVWLSQNDFTDGMNNFCMDESKELMFFYADCLANVFPTKDPQVDCRCCTICCSEDMSDSSSCLANIVYGPFP